MSYYGRTHEFSLHRTRLERLTRAQQRDFKNLLEPVICFARAGYRRRGELSCASFDYGAKLDGNPFHAQSARTFVKILRTWREPLPAAPL